MQHVALLVLTQLMTKKNPAKLIVMNALRSPALPNHSIRHQVGTEDWWTPSLVHMYEPHTYNKGPFVSRKTP